VSAQPAPKAGSETPAVDKWLRGHDLVWPFITSQGLRDAVAADMRALAERAAAKDIRANLARQAQAHEQARETVMIGRLLCWLGLHRTPNRWYRHCYYWEAQCTRCRAFVCNGRRVKADE
jgi:hypothetical protein